MSYTCPSYWINVSKICLFVGLFDSGQSWYETLNKCQEMKMSFCLDLWLIIIIIIIIIIDYIFSEIELIKQCSLGTVLMFCMALFNLFNLVIGQLLPIYLSDLCFRVYWISKNFKFWCSQAFLFQKICPEKKLENGFFSKKLCSNSRMVSNLTWLQLSK